MGEIDPKEPVAVCWSNDWSRAEPVIDITELVDSSQSGGDGRVSLKRSFLGYA
jgi:hypothetical protein